MLKQISLDDSNYDVIFERAMERLHEQAPWWTHTEVSDPGIMLLEMWGVLSDMQSFYLDQVQESHYRKYLKLLGVPPEEGESAWAWIFFEHVERGCVVPGGTKLLSGRVVFETETEINLTTNNITGLYLNTDVNEVGAMKRFRGTRIRLAEEGEELFAFTLKEPLKAGEEFGFFVLLYEDEEGGVRRNPVEKGFFMAELAWEYWGEDGWHRARVVNDDTRGLLFSGYVCLYIDTPMADCGRGYEIRCMIKEGAYDVVPSLCKICLNVVRAVQRNTLCCEEEADVTDGSHEISLKSYLARTGRLWIFKRTGLGDEELWEDITESPDVAVEPPVTADCMERKLFYAGEGHVKIVCAAVKSDAHDTETVISQAGLPEEVTGVAAQEIALPWENLMRPSVRLMLKQGDGRKGLYRECYRAEPEEGRYGNVWHWKEEENVVVLGDGRHGDIPSASKDGLRFLSLALWEGEKGNVAAGGITRWERPELFGHITCVNRLAGQGGRDRKSPSVQFEDVGENIFWQNRMATEADIQELVMATPGLMLREAGAEWKGNMTIVKVKPACPLKSSWCAEKYRRQILDYLEQYRLAGTKIHVEII